MIIVPIPIFFQPYTKKEDVRDIPNWQRKGSALVLIGLTVVIGIMHLFVVPRLTNLYNNLNTPTLLLTQSSTYITGIIAIGALIAAVYLLTTKPDYSKVDVVASKYKDGEMIKTKELMDNKLQWIPMILVFLGVGYLVLSIILPIYSLTSQYK